MTRARKYKALETALGYRFKSEPLLERAHPRQRARRRQGAARDNERLEFLGDRVLGLAIAEVLGEAHPAASEGDLARGYNRLVRGQTCACVARDIGLVPT